MVESFTLGPWSVSPAELAITHLDGEKSPLPSKSMEVLLYLAQEYPRVVARAELIDEVWSGNYAVGEKSLTNAIWNLRSAFSDSSEHPEYIETVRKSGYKLKIQPVYQEQEEVLEQQEEQQSLESSDSPPTSRLKVKTLVVAAFVFSILTMLGFIWKYSEQTQISNPRIEDVTITPGNEYDPAVSPNGEFIAYGWQPPGKTRNIYIRAIANLREAPKQISFSGNASYAPVWGKSGAFVYFIQVSTANRCQIMSYELATSTESTLAQCDMQENYSLALSASGDALLFLSDAPTPGYMTLRLANLETKFVACQNCPFRITQITPGPEEKEMLVSAINNDGSGHSLYLIKDKSVQILSKPVNQITGIAWHPDNQQVLAAIKQKTRSSLLAVNLKTHATRVLPLHQAVNPSFAKESKKLIYQDAPPASYIASLNLEHQHASLHPLLKSRVNYQEPDFNPHANKLTYVSDLSGYKEVWIANKNGSKRQQLTFLKGSASHPRWSNTGDKIAFSSVIKGKHYLYILDLKNEKLSSVAHPFSHIGALSWRLDNSGLVLSGQLADTRELFFIPLDSSPVQQLSFDGATRGFELSTNTLVYTRKGVSGVFSKHFTDKSGASVLSQGSVKLVRPLANQELLLVSETPTLTTLVILSTQTGMKRTLLSLPAGTLSSDAVGISPSGKNLFVSLLPVSSQDLKSVQYKNLFDGN